MNKILTATMVAGTSLLSLGVALPVYAGPAPQSITGGDGASGITVDLGQVADTENSHGRIQLKSDDDRERRGLGIDFDGLLNRDGSGRGITAVSQNDEAQSAIGVDLARAVDTDNSHGRILVQNDGGRDNRGVAVNLDGLFNRRGSARGITAVSESRDGTFSYAIDFGNVLDR